MPDQSAPVRARALPVPIDVVDPALYRIVLDKMDGKQVVRICTRENGDELIVDAATGRLIAVREPNGKTTLWPASRNNAPHIPPT